MIRNIKIIFRTAIQCQTILMLALTITVSLSDPVQAQDGRAAWEKSYVYIDGNLQKGAPNHETIKNAKSVLLYFHGCAGLKRESDTWARFISRQGILVITPDSFAESNRKISCILGERDGSGSNINTRELNRSIRKLRKAEIQYALDVVQNNKTQKTKIFIMGFSEGANAVTIFPFSNISGIIITGHTCWRGIAAKSNIPILAVQWQHDPNFSGNFRDDSCSEYLKGRNVLSKQILLSGSGHDTAESAEAKQAVKEFLTLLNRTN